MRPVGARWVWHRGSLGYCERFEDLLIVPKWKVYLRHFEAILGIYWNLWIFSSSGWLLLCPVAVDPKLHFSYFSLPSFRPGIQQVTYITSTSAYFCRFPNIHQVSQHSLNLSQDNHHQRCIRYVHFHRSALHCAKVSESSSFMLEL
jgi:hypothetical protein